MQAKYKQLGLKMKYSKQTIWLEYKLEEGHFISSEIEIKFDKLDDISVEECLAEAREDLAQTLANGRPEVYAGCCAALGIRCSVFKLEEMQKEHDRVCAAIEDLQYKIRYAEEAYRTLIDTLKLIEEI